MNRLRRWLGLGDRKGEAMSEEGQALVDKADEIIQQHRARSEAALGEAHDLLDEVRRVEQMVERDRR